MITSWLVAFLDEDQTRKRTIVRKLISGVGLVNRVLSSIFVHTIVEMSEKRVESKV